MQNHAECGKLRKQKEPGGRVRKRDEKRGKFKHLRLPKFGNLGNSWAPNSKKNHFCLPL